MDVIPSSVTCSINRHAHVESISVNMFRLKNYDHDKITFKSVKLQPATYKSAVPTQSYNLEILMKKSHVMVSKGTYPVKSKTTLVNVNQVLEQVFLHSASLLEAADQYGYSSL